MNTSATAIDPVCGMTVDKATAQHKSVSGDQTYYFCSAHCKDMFDKDPEKFQAEESPHSH